MQNPPAWEPGLKGKAAIFGVDSLAGPWAVNDEGYPNHYVVMPANGIFNFIALEVDEQGGVSVLFGDPNAGDIACAKDSRLHVKSRGPHSGEWNFSHVRSEAPGSPSNALRGSTLGNLASSPSQSLRTASSDPKFVNVGQGVERGFRGGARPIIGFPSHGERGTIYVGDPGAYHGDVYDSVFRNGGPDSAHSRGLLHAQDDGSHRIEWLDGDPFNPHEQTDPNDEWRFASEWEPDFNEYHGWTVNSPQPGSYDETMYPTEAGNPSRDDTRVVVAYLPDRQIFVGHPGMHHGDVIKHYGLDADVISRMPRDVRQYHDFADEDPYAWTSDEAPMDEERGADLHYGWISDRGGYSHVGPKPEGVTEALHAKGHLAQPDGGTGADENYDPSDWHFGAEDDANAPNWHDVPSLIEVDGKIYEGDIGDYHAEVAQEHGLTKEQLSRARFGIPNGLGGYKWIGPEAVAQRREDEQELWDTHWHFGHKLASEFNYWQHGTHGKGFLLNDGTPVTWSLTEPPQYKDDDRPEAKGPHHTEVAGRMGLGEFPEGYDDTPEVAEQGLSQGGWHTPVYIKPDGTVHTLNYWPGAEEQGLEPFAALGYKTEEAQQAQEDGVWHFGSDLPSERGALWPWEPGTWGKGSVGAAGEVHHWQVDAQGDHGPTHVDALMHMGLWEGEERWANDPNKQDWSHFVINPKGEVQSVMTGAWMPGQQDHEVDDYTHEAGDLLASEIGGHYKRQDGFYFAKTSSFEIHESDFDPANSVHAEDRDLFTHRPYIEKGGTIIVGDVGTHHQDLVQHHLPHNPGMDLYSLEGVTMGSIDQGFVRPYESTEHANNVVQAVADHYGLDPALSRADEWHFGKQANDMWDFVAPGPLTHKALVMNDGTTHVWPYESNMHHQDFMKRNGINFMNVDHYFDVHGDKILHVGTHADARVDKEQARASVAAQAGMTRSASSSAWQEGGEGKFFVHDGVVHHWNTEYGVPGHWEEMRNRGIEPNPFKQQCGYIDADGVVEGDPRGVAEAVKQIPGTRAKDNDEWRFAGHGQDREGQHGAQAPQERGLHGQRVHRVHEGRQAAGIRQARSQGSQERGRGLVRGVRGGHGRAGDQPGIVPAEHVRGERLAHNLTPAPDTRHATAKLPLEPDTTRNPKVAVTTEDSPRPLRSPSTLHDSGAYARELRTLLTSPERGLASSLPPSEARTHPDPPVDTFGGAEGLRVWDIDPDAYAHEDLAVNWGKVDYHDNGRSMYEHGGQRHHCTSTCNQYVAHAQGDDLAQSRPSRKGFLTSGSIREAFDAPDAESKMTYHYSANGDPGTPAENGGLVHSGNMPGLDWEPGTAGKGIVHRGGVLTWTHAPDGTPHHYEVAKKHGLGTWMNYDEFHIHPNGQVSIGNHRWADRIPKADPRLSVVPPYEWHFSSNRGPRRQADGSSEVPDLNELPAGLRPGSMEWDGKGFGKGLVLHDGTVHTWNIDPEYYDGEPWHEHYMEAHGIGRHELRGGPIEGRLYFSEGDKVADQIPDPERDPDEWHFASAPVTFDHLEHVPAHAWDRMNSGGPKEDGWGGRLPLIYDPDEEKIYVGPADVPHYQVRQHAGYTNDADLAHGWVGYNPEAAYELESDEHDNYGWYYGEVPDHVNEAVAKHFGFEGQPPEDMSTWRFGSAKIADVPQPSNYGNMQLFDATKSRLYRTHHGDAVPWELGVQGKGMIHNGVPYLWRAEGYDPHHPEAMMAVEPRYNGNRGLVDFSGGLFVVSPEGEVQPALWDHGDLNEFAQHHPDLHVKQQEGDWHFGATQRSSAVTPFIYDHVTNRILPGTPGGFHGDIIRAHFRNTGERLRGYHGLVDPEAQRIEFMGQMPPDHPKVEQMVGSHFGFAPSHTPNNDDWHFAQKKVSMPPPEYPDAYYPVIETATGAIVVGRQDERHDDLLARHPHLHATRHGYREVWGGEESKTHWYPTQAEIEERTRQREEQYKNPGAIPGMDLDLSDLWEF